MDLRTHADQPIVLDYQSPEHSPSLSTTSLSVRTQPQINTGTSVSLEPESSGVVFLPVTSLIHPQALHPDPLQNELTRILKQIHIRREMYKNKRSQRQREQEEELGKVRKKYKTLFQEDESEYNKDKKHLDTIYNKVLLNRILAEEFRSQFMTKPSPSSSPRGQSPSPLPQFHHLQMLQGRPTSPASALSSRPSFVPSAPRPSSVPSYPKPSSVPSPAAVYSPRPSSVPSHAPVLSPMSSSVPSAPRPSSVPSPASVISRRPSSVPSSPRPSPIHPFGPLARYTPAPPSSGPSNTSTPSPGLVHTTQSVIPTIPNFRPPSKARTTPSPCDPAPHVHRYRPPSSSLPPPPASVVISSPSSTAVQHVDTTGSSIGKLNLNPADLRRLIPTTVVELSQLTSISEAAPPATAATTLTSDLCHLKPETNCSFL